MRGNEVMLTKVGTEVYDLRIDAEMVMWIYDGLLTQRARLIDDMSKALHRERYGDKKKASEEIVFLAGSLRRICEAMQEIEASDAP